MPLPPSCHGIIFQWNQSLEIHLVLSGASQLWVCIRFCSVTQCTLISCLAQSKPPSHQCCFHQCHNQIVTIVAGTHEFHSHTPSVMSILRQNFFCEPLPAMLTSHSVSIVSVLTRFSQFECWIFGNSIVQGISTSGWPCASHGGCS